MQIVINLDENIFTRLFDNGIDVNDNDAEDIYTAIRGGIVLPEGHGDLVDRACLYDFKEWLNTCPEDCNKDDEIWFTSTEVINKIKQYPTIIQADKE